MSALSEAVDLAVADATSMIHFLLQEMALMGANDHEPSTVFGILKAMQSGNCSPMDAVTQVRSIKASKLDAAYR